MTVFTLRRNKTNITTAAPNAARVGGILATT